jgi:Helix-hairpin-helix domain
MANIAQNQGIARRLREVAQLLADQGANRFRVRAYRAAAGTISLRRGSPVGIDPRCRVVGPLGLLEGGIPGGDGDRYRPLPLSRLPFERRQARVRAVRTNGAHRLGPARCHRGYGGYTKVRKVGGYVVTPPSATIPWPSSRPGNSSVTGCQRSRGKISPHSTDGITSIHSEGGRADPQLRASSGIPSLTPSHAMRKDSQLLLTIPFRQYRIIT